ncbi:MAG: nucleoside deaminase [Pyrinomonadaceae bacterium]
MKTPVINIDLPLWVGSFVSWDTPYVSDEEKISLAIKLAMENLHQSTGGPFGAAIFDAAGKVLSIGTNQVLRSNNSCLHAEVIAIMMAQAALKSYSLNSQGMPRYELFTSCEPCCMCLGAILWSGLSRVVCAATKDDASRIGFDEGPVYESSYEYLQDRGIEVRRGLLREEAVKAFDLYKEKGGIIYNG